MKRDFSAKQIVYEKLSEAGTSYSVRIENPVTWKRQKQIAIFFHSFGFKTFRRIMGEKVERKRGCSPISINNICEEKSSSKQRHQSRKYIQCDEIEFESSNFYKKEGVYCKRESLKLNKHVGDSHKWNIIGKIRNNVSNQPLLSPSTPSLYHFCKQGYQSCYFFFVFSLVHRDANDVFPVFIAILSYFPFCMFFFFYAVWEKTVLR